METESSIVNTENDTYNHKQTIFRNRKRNTIKTRRTTKLDHFNDMKNKEEQKLKEEKEDDDYETMKMKIKMIDKDEINKQLNSYIFVRDRDYKSYRMGNLDSIFGKTRYSEENAFTQFYEKYKYSEKMIKKGIDYQTPSFNFIKSVKSNKIIPNPVGILKRTGNENSLELK